MTGTITMSGTARNLPIFTTQCANLMPNRIALQAAAHSDLPALRLGGCRDVADVPASAPAYGRQAIWFTVFKLKRVDASDTHFHISNYFKNFRYPVADIESIRVRDIGIATVAKMTLLAEGSFGKKIYFLLSKRNVQKYLVAFQEGNGLFTDLP
ncbi:MAG: hypothetical protein ACKOEM_10190 [Planctomycetia bacterium]